jgi:hypothetical protein
LQHGAANKETHMIRIIDEVINKSSTLLLKSNNTSTGDRHARGSHERHGRNFVAAKQSVGAVVVPSSLQHH